MKKEKIKNNKKRIIIIAIACLIIIGVVFCIIFSPKDSTSDNPNKTYDIVIENALTNIISNQENPTTIKNDEIANLSFSAKNNYVLPDTVSVTGATSTWDQATGILTLSNPTSTVKITIYALNIFSITTTLTNITANINNSENIIEGHSSTLTFTADEGYGLPDIISITGLEANNYIWDPTTGLLTLNYPIDDVSVSMTAEYLGYFLDANNQKITFRYLNAQCTYLTKEMTGLDASGTSYLIPSGTKKIVLPEGITSIANYAFIGVDLSQDYPYPTITKITSLQEIILPDTLSTIGDYSFDNCQGLTNITLPDSITSIGESAFCDCPELSSITLPENIVTLNNNIFSGCLKLTSITLPNSITTIGDYAFSMSGLTTINLENITSIGESAFERCNYLDNITIHNNTLVGEQAFLSCTNLQNIVLGNNVSISESAFSNCTSLETIDLTNITTLSDSAFMNCSSLKNITLSNSLTELPFNVFAQCSNLESVTLPTSLQTIAENAFLNCSSLTTINLSNVTYCGPYAFAGCGFENITLPNGLEYVEMGLFSNCVNLTNVIIPNTITAIYAYAFQSCSALVTIDLSNISTLGEGVFNNCSQLGTVILSNCLTELESDLFSNCSNLEVIEFNGTTSEWISLEKASNYEFLNEYTGLYLVSCTDGTIDFDGTITTDSQE